MKLNDPKDWFGQAGGFGGGRQLQPQTWEGWTIVMLIAIVAIFAAMVAGRSGIHP